MTIENKGPQFLKYMIPIIDALKVLGGSARSAEVIDYVVEKLNINDEELAETIKSGQSRIKNQIAWARMYHVKGGYIDSSKRGIWSLTEKGLKANLNNEDVYKLFKKIQSGFDKTENNDSIIKNKEDELKDESKIEIPEEEIEYPKHRKELMLKLRNLPPEGFERICKRLLLEYGFQKVIVTGKSGDGGIDGYGFLEINPFVNFKIIFQCKRYQGYVSTSQVRDFRGAMDGRGSVKGIILTTGGFTIDAKKEAIREGAQSIELIDGEKLIEIFEKLELGLKPKKIYEINKEFFHEFE